MEVLNWKLLSHPLNWVIVALMVFLAAVAAHLVLGVWGGIEPKGETA